MDEQQEHAALVEEVILLRRRVSELEGTAEQSKTNGDSRSSIDGLDRKPAGSDNRASETPLQAAYEELKTRVADRTREIEQANAIMQALVDGTASATGADFFLSFAKAMAGAFGSRYILVCEHLDSPATRVRTHAFWTGEGFANNVEYDLVGGPCAETAMGEMTFHSSNLQELFPDDKDLVTLEAESYCGIPLFNSTGEIIGHLAIMDDRPMSQNLCEVPALPVFVARVASELERIQADAALRENERRLKTLIASAPLVVSSIGKDGQFDFFDGAALKKVGFEPGRFVGENFFDLWKTRPAMTASMEKCLAGDTPDLTTMEINGRLLDTRYSPLRSEEGDIEGAITVCVDVTDQRRAEAAMRESEQRLRLVTDSLPAFISYMDKTRRYQFVNKRYEEVFGVAREEILGKHIWEVLGDDNYRAIERYIDLSLTGETVEYEAPLQVPGKPDLAIHARYVPDISPDGEVRGNYVMITDVTEKKREEDARERTNIALANSMPGISRLNAEGCYVEVNDAYAEMVGYQPDDLLGNSWMPTVHIDDQPHVIEAYQRMLQDGQGEAEARGVRKDGSIFYKRVLMVRGDDSDAGGHYCFMRDISERKQAEAERLEAVLRYESIAQSVPDCVWSVRATECGTCSVEYVSPGWKEIWGYEPEAIYRNPNLWGEAIVEEDQAEFRKQFLHSVTTATTKTLNYRIRSKDGELRWIEDRILAVVTDEDRVITVEGIARDVTAEKQIEEERREKHNLLTAVMEGTSDPIFLKDGEGRYQMVNSATARTMGLPAHEVVGKDDSQLFPPEIAEQIRRDDLHVKSTGESVTIEETMLTADSETPRTYLTFKTPYRDHDGEIAGLIGLARNITARKKSEEALAESEARYRTLFDTCQDAIIVADAVSGEIIDANGAALNLTLLSIEEMIGKSIFHFSPADDRRYHEGILRQHVELGGSYDTNLRLQQADGEIVYVDVSTSVFQLGDRHLVQGVFRDITNAKLLEEQEQRHRNELAHVARLNTMGEMTTALAHELNQPLAAMANYAYAAEKEISSQEGAAPSAQTLSGTIVKLKEQAVRAGDIVRRMRGFVQKVGPMRSECDLNAI